MRFSVACSSKFSDLHPERCPQYPHAFYPSSLEWWLCTVVLGAWEKYSQGLIRREAKLLILLEGPQPWESSSEQKVFHPRQNLNKTKRSKLINASKSLKGGGIW